MDIKVNGSTADSFIGKMASEETCIGKSSEEILAMLDIENGNTVNISSGATKSDFLVVYSALFATANYETAVAGGQS